MVYTSTTQPDDRIPSQTTSSGKNFPRGGGSRASTTPTTNTSPYPESPAEGPLGVTLNELLEFEDLQQQDLQAALSEIQANMRLSLAGSQQDAASIANQRAATQDQLQRGIRDINLAEEEGVEAATANALQRGIYRSGIRQEMQEDVREDAARERGDLRAQTQFALRDLSLRAGALRERIAAVRNQGQVQSINAVNAANTEINQLRDYLQETYGIDFDWELQQLANAQNTAPTSTPSPTTQSGSSNIGRLQ